MQLLYSRKDLHIAFTSYLEIQVITGSKRKKKNSYNAVVAITATI